MLYSKTEKIAYLYLSLIRFRRLSENLLHHFSNSLLQKVLEAEPSPPFVYFVYIRPPRLRSTSLKYYFFKSLKFSLVLYIRSLFIIIRV